MSISLVHVAGLTVLKGQAAYYRLDNGREICSVSTIVPLAIKLMEEELKSIIAVLPHSLIVHSRREIGEDYERWFKESTEHLSEDFQERLEEFAVVDSTGIDESTLKSLKNLLREGLRTRVVQAHGSFRSDDGWKVTFHGDPAHTFAEVYAALLREGSERVHVDLSQGWNHYTVAALLGATAYSKVSGAELRLHYAEPFVRGLTKQCNPGKGLGGGRGSGSSQGKNTAARVPDDLPAPTSLGIGTLQTVSQLNEVVERLSEIMNVSGAIIEIPKLVSLYQTLREEFRRYKSHGNLARGHDTIMRALLRLRRTSCAFSTTVVPYLHRSLEMLSEVESSLDAIRDRLLEMTEERSFLEASLKLEGSRAMEVHYCLKPPLSLPLADALLKVIRSFLGLRMDGDQRRGRMPLSLIDRLRRKYEELGMVPNMVLLDKEMDLVDDQGNIRSVLVSLRDQSRKEGVIKKLKEYFLLLEKVVLSIGNVPGIERDIYPFFVVERIKKDEKDIEDKLTKDERSWEMERSQWISDLKAKSCNPNKRESPYERNLRVALSLMDPCERDLLSPSDIKTLKRHLQAHAGFQHFSIRNLDPKGSDVYVLYYDRLFDALEKRASLPKEVDCLPDDLKEEAASLCDEVK